MSRLDKVCAVWDNLEKTYVQQNKKLKSKGEKELTRLEFLRRLTKYTGTIDDLTRFKSMFSNEIRKYSQTELKKYEKLLEYVSEILEIIGLCTPTKNQKPIFTLENDLTIDEIVMVFREYKEKTVYSVKSNEKIVNMNLFNDNRTKEEESIPEIASKTAEVVDYKKIIKDNQEGFSVINLKNNCKFKDLFNAGKLSNYFEMSNGKISYMCVDSQYKDYVYIADKASFYHYIIWFSANSSSADDFNISVFLFLMNTYENAKNGKERFKFPYVFTKKEFLKETAVSFILGSVVFRKNTAKYLKLKDIEFSDLVGKSHRNKNNIIALRVTNNSTPYTVCVVESNAEK